MKILLINKFHYMKGGSETYYFAQAEALEAKGHEVIFFAMQDKKNFPCEQSKYFTPHVDYNAESSLKARISAAKNFFYSEDAAEKMEALIKEEKPDIAHIGLLHRQITFSVVKMLKKHCIPVVMTMHDLIFACPNYTMLSNGKTCEACVEGSSINCVIKRCVKESTTKSILAAWEKHYLLKKNYYDLVDLYIAESNCYKKLIKKSKVTTSRIIQKTNFLPVNQTYKFDPNYQDYILYFGRFSGEKGIITLLKSHENLKCKYKIIIVGSGPIENEITSYISKHQLSNIELPGAIYGDEMEHIIEAAKVIIVPSEWYENCPYTLLQSIAKGKIVVASRIGGLPELINDGDTGFLFEPGNVADLSSKIDFVMKMDKISYDRMANHICTEAKKHHDWENYTDMLINEYQKLINSKL